MTPKQAVFLATGTFGGACHFGMSEGRGRHTGPRMFDWKKKTNWCFSYLTSKFSEPISLAAAARWRQCTATVAIIRHWAVGVDFSSSGHLRPLTVWLVLYSRYNMCIAVHSCQQVLWRRRVFFIRPNYSFICIICATNLFTKSLLIHKKNIGQRETIFFLQIRSGKVQNPFLHQFIS